MATVRVSPGIFVNELDFSQYALKLGLTRPLFLGGATKGPEDEPTLVNNRAELIETFGNPVETDYGLLSAIKYLDKGGQLLFMRVSDKTPVTGAVVADIDVTGLSGGTAAVAAIGTVVFTGSLNPTDGETVSIRDGSDAVQAFGTINLDGGANPADTETVTIYDGTNTVIFEFDSGGGITGDVAVVIGATAAATMTNLINAINASILEVTATDTTVGDPNCTVTQNQPGAAGNSSTIAEAAAAITVDATFGGGSDGTAVTFEFDDDSSYGGSSVPVLIGATAAETLVNLINAINGSSLTITATDTTVTVPEATLTNQIGGLLGNFPVLETGANITATGMAGGVDAIAGSVTTVMTLLASSSGSWGNSIEVEVLETQTIGAPAGRFDLKVSAPVDRSGVIAQVEFFGNLSLDPNDGVRYIENALAEGIDGEVRPSDYIRADVIEETGEPSAATYLLGQGGGTAGLDGITGLASTDYIGTVTGMTATGLKAAQNAEKIEYNVLAIPGITHTDVVDEMIATAEKRADCIVIVDPPFGLDKEGVIDWHNGDNVAVPNAPTSPLDSNYAMLAWSWVRTSVDELKKKLWLPPSGFVAGNMAVTDQTSGPWLAIGGFTRGLIDGEEVEYSPDLEDRNDLMGIDGQNRVNAIVQFQSDGVVFFGNRTLQRARSALDNIHVRRLLLHAEKLCATSVKYLLFDPNDPVTWKKFEILCNAVLSPIQAERGLEKFKVICDESTNPASQRAQKKMRGKLLLKVIEAAEIIELDFAIFSTGAEFTEFE